MVLDNMNWVNNGSIQNNGSLWDLNSPDLLPGSDCSLMYRITANTNCGITPNTFTGTGGVVIPANHNNCNDDPIPCQITFSDPVYNLRIRFSDMDMVLPQGNPGPPESIIFDSNNIPDSKTDVVLTTAFSGGNQVLTATSNNASTDVFWAGPITQINFNYTRPASGYLVIIDQVSFDYNNAVPFIQAENSLGTTTVGSIWGDVEIERFCSNDVLADGSLTFGESQYHLNLSEINLSTGQMTGLYSGWISGEAPSGIDVANQFGVNVNFVPGQTYSLALSTGPCWETSYMTFIIEECCPEEVALTVNCEAGTIEIQGIPAGVTGVYTNWYKRKKFGGYQLISSSNGLQSSLNVAGNGTYLVEFQIILANGEVCTYSESVVYSEDACCELLGPTLDAWLLDNVLYYETVYSQTYGWSVQVPVICNLDPYRLVEIATSSTCIDFYNYTNSKFDANSWSNVGPLLVNVSGNGNPPNYIGLMYYNFATGNSEVAPNELNHFQLQTQAPYQVVDLLYIPTTICGKVTGLISNEEQLALYNFNAFPNPGKNQLKMSVSLDSEVKYSIVDISGRIVSTGSYFMNTELDVSQLSPGTYTIVSTLNGDTFNYKWIKE